MNKQKNSKTSILILFIFWQKWNFIATNFWKMNKLKM
jgi:hypothetical protein